MVFLKQTKIKQVDSKYGSSQKGLFANEAISKGQLVFVCNDACPYNNISDEEIHTKESLDRIQTKFESDPNFLEHIKRHTIAVDIEKFYFPKQNFMDCDCIYLNHSCDSNLGIASNGVVAIKDIEKDEELTLNYNFLAYENDMDYGLKCKCGADECVGVLNFNIYRNVDWQKKNYNYCKPFIQKLIDELYTKWYSSSCRLKISKGESGDRLFLVTLRKIKKGELVAVFFSSEIKHENHYLSQNNKPNCYLDGKKVFALENIELPDTQLTLNFNKIY